MLKKNKIQDSLAIGKNGKHVHNEIFYTYYHVKIIQFRILIFHKLKNIKEKFIS